jgi:dCTP deaminase
LEKKTELRQVLEPVDSSDAFVENAVRSTLDSIYEIVKEVIPDESCAKLTDQFFSRITSIKHDLPPSCEVEDNNSFSEIFSAAWAYQLQFGEIEERKKDTLDKKRFEFETTCNLVLKSVELIPFCSNPDSSVAKDNCDTTKKMPDQQPASLDQPHGVLGKQCIADRIDLPISNKSSIQIIPFNREGLNTVSLDLRLGNWFTVARKSRLRGFTIGIDPPEKIAMFAREEIFIPHKEKFVIHPGDLVLGTTLEFVALPGNVMAYVEGKSKIGRMGLIIATASKIDPGFHGVIVLELVNAGTVPLEIEPGSVVAQLIFQGLNAPLKEEDLYRKEYYCQIKPK